VKKELIDSWIREAETFAQAGAFGRSEQSAEQIHQFALSMLSAFYGENSVQVRSYLTSHGAFNLKEGAGMRAIHVGRTAAGAIQSTLGQIKAGLVLSVRAQAKGEVFADLVNIANEVLENDSEDAKNTVAVLVAAAFEDAVRTLAADKANVAGRPKLEQVVNALNAAGILQGGNYNMALGYLKFRNDSLHADWAKVSRHQVESCLSFVEMLIRDHMS